MNDHQLAPITEILPPVPHVPQSRQTSQSVIRGEDGQLYRLEPMGKATANHLGRIMVWADIYRGDRFNAAIAPSDETSTTTRARCHSTAAKHHKSRLFIFLPIGGTTWEL